MIFIHFIDKDTVHLSRTKLPLQPTRAFLGIILLSLRSYFHLKFFNKFFPNIFSQISGLPSRIDMGLTGKSCCLEIRDQHVCHSATFSSSPDLVESLNLAQPQAYSHLSPCHILLWLAWQTSPSDDPLSLPLPLSRKGGGAEKHKQAHVWHAPQASQSPCFWCTLIYPQALFILHFQWCQWLSYMSQRQAPCP